MKVVMISKDNKVLDRGSAVFNRMKEYSHLFEELHVVVLAKHHSTENLSIIDGGLNIHNTTSFFRFISFLKVFFAGYGLFKRIGTNNTWITTQDPFESGVLGFLISKLSGVKFQIQIHTNCFNYFYVKHSVTNMIRFLVARFLIPRSSSVRVVSRELKQTLVNLKLIDSSKISVLPVFVDITAIQNAKIIHNLKEEYKEFQKIILVVARLESEKNIDLAIKSFQKTLRINDGLGLVIVGAGSKEVWLKKLTKYLMIEKSVRFIGWSDDVVSLYKTSDVLLVTSFYEGYGMNMVEASACGLPVISTDVGVARDIGATIVTYDPGKIALELINILNQKKVLALVKVPSVSKEQYLKAFKETFK